MMRYGKNDFPPVPAGTVLHGWGSPYALIRRGGGEPGKRPKTALAFIVYAKGEDGGRRIKLKALIRRGNGWTQARPLELRDVVKYWRNKPAPATVAKARNGLKPIQAAPAFNALNQSAHINPFQY